MRLRTPRVKPFPVEEADEEQQAILDGVSGRFSEPLNIFTTLAKKPAAARAYLNWATYALLRTNLDPRLREIAILRVGWNCKAGYEWTQHTRIGLESGLTLEEIESLKRPPAGEPWTPLEHAIIDAADEVCSRFFVSERTWVRLSEHYDEEQVMDLVYVLGQYLQTCVFLNTFGVQVEDGTPLDEDLCRYAPED